MDDLLAAMNDAHYHSAINNNNVSSAVIMQMALVGKAFPESVAAALLTLGDVHGPTAQARHAIYYATTDEIENDIEEDLIIPGFGNAFYKDSIDPAWAQFDMRLRAEFPDVAREIDRIADMISYYKKKKIYPNPAAFTATVAELQGAPLGTEISLLITARMPAWVELWAMNQR